MNKNDIATLLEEAAGLLGLEEVMYALGLDSDHVQTVDYVEATLPDGSTRVVEVPIPEDVAEAAMEKAIEQHGVFVGRLAEAATALREGDRL